MECLRPTPHVLHIALQDGFDDDLVVVEMNGAEVFRRDDVRTDPRTALATAFELPVPAGRAVIHAKLPRRRMTGSLAVDPSASAHLAISVVDGELRLTPASQPFGYV